MATHLRRDNLGIYFKKQGKLNIINN